MTARVRLQQTTEQSILLECTAAVLGGARDRDATLSLLLLSVHEKGEGERALAEALGLSFQLLQLTLRQTAKLEDKAAGGCALAAVDMAANHDGEVLLFGIGRHDYVTLNSKILNPKFYTNSDKAGTAAQKRFVSNTSNIATLERAFVRACEIGSN